jgi:MFS family permease
MRAHLFFFGACLLFLLLKGKVLFDFAFIYTDHDQCTLWHAAVETANGHFHEPCFYGQSYNSNLEAWLAAPLVLLSIPVEVALPLITTLLSVLIFLIPSFAHHYRGQTNQAWIFLLLGLVLPAQFHLVHSMPRGFINGLFIVAMGYAYYVFSNQKRKHFFLFLSMVLGFWINPNSALLSAAIFLLIWLPEYRNHWKSALTGALLGNVYKLFTTWFYAKNPLYDYHKKNILEFEWEEWAHRFSHLDQYFFNFSWFFVLLLAIAAIGFLIKKNYAQFGLLVVFLVFFLLTLGMERVGDGMRSLYYHHSRMFLAMPLAVAVALVAAFNVIELKFSAKGYIVASLVCGAIFFSRWFEVDEKVQAEFLLNDHGVQVEKVKDVVDRYNRIAAACQSRNVELVVFAENCNSCWIDTYAIPALSKGSINTLNLREDRRAWRFDEEMKMTSRNMLVLSCSDPGQIRTEQEMFLANEKEKVSACYFLSIEGNVPDYFRPLLKHLRYGY